MEQKQNPAILLSMARRIYDIDYKSLLMYNFQAYSGDFALYMFDVVRIIYFVICYCHYHKFITTCKQFVSIYDVCFNIVTQYN